MLWLQLRKVNQNVKATRSMHTRTESAHDCRQTACNALTHLACGEANWQCSTDSSRHMRKLEGVRGADELGHNQPVQKPVQAANTGRHGVSRSQQFCIACVTRATEHLRPHLIRQTNNGVPLEDVGTNCWTFANRSFQAGRLTTPCID